MGTSGSNCQGPAVVRQQFKALFCERFDCPPEKYEAWAFRRCLYFHARFLARLIRKLNPAFFAEDWSLLQYLGAAASSREANAEIRAFQDANRQKPNWLRTGLQIRISGRKAARLARQVFAAVKQKGA